MSPAVRRWAPVLCGVLLLGCGSGLVKLDTKKVRGVGLTLGGGGKAVCQPGLLPEIVALVSMDDGKMLETRTPVWNPDGKLRPTEFAWTSEVGKVHENGVLELPLDLLKWHDRTFVVRATIPKRPEFKPEILLTPRFDCGGEVPFKGLDGEAGWGNSADGQPGGPGPRVDVALAYVDTKLNGRLILVRVIDYDLGRREYYLVDPRGRRLIIDANGGTGGNGTNGIPGRNGSSGERGVDGATGAFCQNGQDGGRGQDGHPGIDGQPGGRGGDGGNGGNVTIHYPAAFPELAQAVSVKVNGGEGGVPGGGGAGGKGGDGGSGGRGGSPGDTQDPVQICNGTTTWGSEGRGGDRGPDGREGARGEPGRPGISGWVSSRPGNAGELFAFEAARGWAIVVDH